MKIGMRTMIAGVVATVAVVACAQTEEPIDDQVVARIGDEAVITASELEELAGPSLVSLRQQIHDAQVNLLTAEIYKRLLREAAEAEGLSEAQYRSKRIDERVSEPDEGEVVKLMTQYRARLAEDDAQARAQIVQALVQRERQRLEADLQNVLFAEAGVKILLTPPRIEVQIAEGTPERGTQDAPVVIVEYTDFQCPFCNRVQPTLDAVLERYEGKVRHVFKNLPLPNHSQAQLAGEAALCAQDQGKFWEFHNWLFKNQRTMNRESMVTAAGELEMDTEAFTACVDGGTYRSRVRQDMAEARGFGITGTPGFLINGRVIKGAQPVEQFEEIIDDELRRRGIDIPPKQAANTAAE